jgi:hypothetical protein
LAATAILPTRRAQATDFAIKAPGGGGWFGGDVFAPFHQQIPRQQAPRRPAPRQILEDFSKAPPPERRETVPGHKVLVLGDAMADWLAFGLEDA